MADRRNKKNKPDIPMTGIQQNIDRASLVTNDISYAKEHKRNKWNQFARWWTNSKLLSSSMTQVTITSLITFFVATMSILKPLFKNPILIYSLPFILVVLQFISALFFKEVEEVKEETNKEKLRESNKRRIELEQKIQLINDIEKRAQNYAASLLSADEIIIKSTSNLYALARKISGENDAPFEPLWDFRIICDSVCEKILTNLLSLPTATNGTVINVRKTFEVSYVKFSDDRSRITVPIFKAPKYGKPAMYGGYHKVTKYANPKKYFERLIHVEQHDIILHNKKEVENHSCFQDISNKDECNFEQYVALPIYCDFLETTETTDIGKPVGFLQIASFIKNGLGESTQIDDLIDARIKPFVHLIVLADKMRKAYLAYNNSLHKNS